MASSSYLSSSRDRRTTDLRSTEYLGMKTLGMFNGGFLLGLQDSECILRSLRQGTVLNTFVVIAVCIFLCSSSIILRA